MTVFHLAFVTWNPDERALVGVRDGTVVRVWDADALSAADLLGSGAIDGGQGRVSIRVEAGERRPDVWFEVLMDEPWSSRNAYASDGRRGLLVNLDRETVGTPDQPLAFRVTFDCFLQLVFWDPRQNRYRGLPTGIPVEAVDADLGRDRILASGVTDREGKVHLTLDPTHEHQPDLYFRYAIPERWPAIVDLPTGELAALSDDGLAIPRTWSSRRAFALERPSRPGYWRNFRGSRVGDPRSPYAFDVLGDPPRWVDGTAVRSVIDGVQMLHRLEALIGEARHSVHLEMLLYFNDPMGDRITEALERRARDGLDVRVMFDTRSTGSSWTWIQLERIWTAGLRRLEPEERARLDAFEKRMQAAEVLRGRTGPYLERLRAAGVQFVDSAFPYVELDPEAASAAPPQYRALEAELPLFTIGRIDHRKLAIADGRRAIFGGQNIGQEYLYERPFDPRVDALDEEWIKWHDVSIELEGPAVRDVQHLFHRRWVASGGQPFEIGPSALGRGTDHDHPTFPALEAHDSALPVKIVRTTPGAAFEFHAEFFGLIDGARHEIWVENPYIAGTEVVAHLADAAERGVRVVFIFPSHHNLSKEFVYNARLKYPALIAAGVEVYEYQRHMTHAKVAVIDDVTVIGSANLNHSSFFNHYEIAAFVQDAAFARQFRRELFQVDLRHCLRIRVEDVPAMLDITPVARVWLSQVVDKRF